MTASSLDLDAICKDTREDCVKSLTGQSAQTIENIGRSVNENESDQNLVQNILVEQDLMSSAARTNFFS